MYTPEKGRQSWRLWAGGEAKGLALDNHVPKRAPSCLYVVSPGSRLPHKCQVWTADIRRSRRPSAERQREAWRRHQQEHRKRRRAAQGQTTSQPGELLGAGEQVIDLAVTEEESVAATLLQLGLRAQGLMLRQDPSALQLPQDAPDNEEHDHLYLTRDAAQPDRIFRQQKPPVGFFRRSAAPVGQPPASRPVPRQLSHCYPSLPSSNPSKSSSATPMARPNADQPLAFSVPTSPATFRADDNVDFNGGASSGANEDACARTEVEKSQEAIEQSPERGEEGTRRDTEEHGQAMAEGAGPAESLRMLVRRCETVTSYSRVLRCWVQLASRILAVSAQSAEIQPHLGFRPLLLRQTPFSRATAQ
ncbi:hypothetical protein LTR53_003551 [Teratosphaeriaceae sp. CCFEE 6253]|nr:hypothetical protein LTR53_003551 [Teratosphaeriaceae sp. CCFEE 6253]